MSVEPGVVDTEMQERLRQYARRDVYFPERDRFVGAAQRGELAQPSEVARRIIAERINATTSAG